MRINALHLLHTLLWRWSNSVFFLEMNVVQAPQDVLRDAAGREVDELGDALAAFRGLQDELLAKVAAALSHVFTRATKLWAAGPWVGRHAMPAGRDATECSPAIGAALVTLQRSLGTVQDALARPVLELVWRRVAQDIYTHLQDAALTRSMDECGAAQMSVDLRTVETCFTSATGVRSEVLQQ